MGPTAKKEFKLGNEKRTYTNYPLDLFLIGGESAYIAGETQAS